MKRYSTTKTPNPISVALLGEARRKATEWSRKHPALGYRKPKKKS